MVTRAEALAELARRGRALPTAKKLTAQEQIQLREAREGAQTAQEFARQAEAFVDLNRQAGTGPIYKVPFVSEVVSVFNPKVAQMDALTARMAPAQRVPGSGTTSDRDLNLFMRAVPNIDRPGTANSAIARDMSATAKKRAARAAFLDRWAAEKGTLMGAEEAWQNSQAAPRPAPAKPRAAGPRPGAVEDGYRFKGGNPADPNSWERVR